MSLCCCAPHSCPSQTALPTLPGPCCPASSGMWWPLPQCPLVPAWHALSGPALSPQFCCPTQPSSGPALAMQGVHRMEQLESNVTMPVSRAGVK